MLDALEQGIIAKSTQERLLKLENEKALIEEQIAYNNGIKTVYIPEDNAEDITNVPLPILEGIEIKLVSNYETIYNDLFKSKIKENDIA